MKAAKRIFLLCICLLSVSAGWINAQTKETADLILLNGKNINTR